MALSDKRILRYFALPAAEAQNVGGQSPNEDLLQLFTL